MRLPLRFRVIAQAEFDEAIAWYDQGGPGLGASFAQAVQDRLDEISQSPQRYPVIEDDVREAPVDGFPYCIYYRVRPGRLVVVAAYHQSRDPAGWRNRPR
jgi:toxin ParE1/3/4